MLAVASRGRGATMVDVATYRELLDQHEALMKALQRLETVLDAPREEHHPGARPRVVLDLEAVRARLADHFAAEEDGGYFAELLADRPDLRARARVVAAQHGEITRALDDVLAREATLDLAALDQPARAVVALVRRHEAEERRLVEDAVQQEVGTPD